MTSLSHGCTYALLSALSAWVLSTPGHLSRDSLVCPDISRNRFVLPDISRHVFCVSRNVRGVLCWFGISRNRVWQTNCLKSRLLRFLEITFASKVHLSFLEMCFVFLEIPRVLFMFLEITCALWRVWLGTVRASFVQNLEPEFLNL